MKRFASVIMLLKTEKSFSRKNSVTDEIDRVSIITVLYVIGTVGESDVNILVIFTVNQSTQHSIFPYEKNNKIFKFVKFSSMLCTLYQYIISMYYK